MPHMRHFYATGLPRPGKPPRLASFGSETRHGADNLFLTVFAMPVALAVMAIVGARAERRSVY